MGDNGQQTGVADVDEALARDIATLQDRDKRLSAAARKPLPGPLLDAFDPVPSPTAKRYGLAIRQPVAADFILFQRLDSPLLKLGQEDLNLTQEQAAEIIYQLTRPPSVCRAALRVSRDHFTEAAMEAVADTVAVPDMAVLFREVRDNYIRWLSTVVEYKEPDKPGETTRSFTGPPTGTASAGG